MRCKIHQVSASIISTHAPREGCDGFIAILFHGLCISTPAPRAGCDLKWPSSSSQPYFNSRTPRGVRLLVIRVLSSIGEFQLTLPMRDATVREVRQDTADTLGLHLNFNSRTRVGYDSTPYVSHVERGAFQLPHPMRGATHNLAVLEKRMFISTPAPAWGATPYTVEQMRYLVFQLSHPVRGATRHKPSHLVLVTFQLPHPVRGATGVEGQAAQTATLFQLTHPMRGAARDLVEQTQG